MGLVLVLSGFLHGVKLSDDPFDLVVHYWGRRINVLWNDDFCNCDDCAIPDKL